MDHNTESGIFENPPEWFRLLLESVQHTTLLTPTEAKAQFEKECQEVVGVSADEFIRKLEAGEYGDPDKSDIPGLMGLVMFKESIYDYCQGGN